MLELQLLQIRGFAKVKLKNNYLGLFLHMVEEAHF